MRAKKLGRHELLSWINTITQSDYPKIENLSDGVGFCQLLDAFYPNIVSLNGLKLNSKNIEDWEKNFCYLNDMLAKIKSFKQIDVTKLSKSKFTQNFELLQFLYDLLCKNFGEPHIKYAAYDKRIDILKNQVGTKINDIKKYLPTHLIPNELILKMDKQKFFPGKENNLNNSQDEEKNDNHGVINLSPHLTTMLEKYKDFFTILKDDLRKIVDKNISYSQEIKDIEEERQYYLEKINNVVVFCQKKITAGKLKEENVAMLDNIVKIITHVPEDFK